MMKVGTTFSKSQTSTVRYYLSQKEHKIPFTKETKDPKGNFIILDVSTQEQRISLVALYGSNEDSPNFFQNLKSKLVSPSDTSIMIGETGMLSRTSVLI
jgi:hypothetical protein